MKNSKIKKSFIALLALINVILITFSGCKGFTEEKGEKNTADTSVSKITETTTKGEEEKITSETETGGETTETQENTTKPQRDENYNKLLKNLKQNLRGKNFGKEAEELVKMSFDSLYDNYDFWKNKFRGLGLPQKEEYIQNMFIDSIPNVSNIYVYDCESEEARNLHEEYGYDTYVDGNNEITFTLYRDGSDGQRFAHEIAHIADRNRGNVFGFNDDMAKLFKEGRASFHQQFASEPSEEKQSFQIRESKDNYIIYYGTVMDNGYADYFYVYTNLVYLIGYDGLESISDNFLINAVMQCLTEKYGSRAATEIFNGLKKWVKTKPTGYFEKSTESYKAALELHEIFIKYILQDINNLKTDRELSEYKNLIEAYKKYILPLVIDDNNNDITDKALDPERIDNAIKKKEKELI